MPDPNQEHDDGMVPVSVLSNSFHQPPGSGAVSSGGAPSGHIATYTPPGPFYSQLYPPPPTSKPGEDSQATSYHPPYFIAASPPTQHHIPSNSGVVNLHGGHAYIHGHTPQFYPPSYVPYAPTYPYTFRSDGEQYTPYAMKVRSPDNDRREHDDREG